MDMRIEVGFEGRPRVREFYYAFMDSVWGDSNEKLGRFGVDFDHKAPKYVLLRSAAPGYWSTLVNLRKHYDKREPVILKKIADVGPLGWWHRLHGIDASDLSRGEGIKIGVVDRSLRPHKENSCIRHVKNLEITRRVPRGVLLQPHMHSSAICSLIASRCSGPAGFQGVAPGAQVVFAAAGHDKYRNRLSVRRVINAIEELTFEHGCDLITVSAGTSAAVPGVRSVMSDALNHGTVCFFPTGNNKIQAKVSYPAAYEEAFSVAALGLCGYAPQETYEFFHERTSPEMALPGHYWWFQSCLNGRVDLAAGGANVIWTEDHAAHGVVCGTSFACPVAAAVAATLLASDLNYRHMPRDRTRSDYVRQTIAKACEAMPPPDSLGQARRSQGWNCGILTL